MTYEEKVRWLRRYQDSLRREQELAEEVEQLRSRACKVTPALTGMPGGTSDGQTLPHAVEQILEVQQELQAQIEQCNSIRKDVIAAIDRTINLQDKEILRRRYVLGESLTKISNITHLEYRWVRKRHKNAVHNITINDIQRLILDKS